MVLQAARYIYASFVHSQFLEINIVRGVRLIVPHSHFVAV